MCVCGGDLRCYLMGDHRVYKASIVGKETIATCDSTDSLAYALTIPESRGVCTGGCIAALHR
jgi:hypothetical protein